MATTRNEVIRDDLVAGDTEPLLVSVEGLSTLTGAKIRCILATKKGRPPIISKDDVADPLDVFVVDPVGPPPTFKLVFRPAETAKFAGWYYFAAKVEDASGDEQTVVTGDLRFAAQDLD